MGCGGWRCGRSLNSSSNSSPKLAASSLTESTIIASSLCLAPAAQFSRPAPRGFRPPKSRQSPGKTFAGGVLSRRTNFFCFRNELTHFRTCPVTEAYAQLDSRKYITAIANNSSHNVSQVDSQPKLKFWDTPTDQMCQENVYLWTGLMP